jgi:hypothetical protein
MADKHKLRDLWVALAAGLIIGGPGLSVGIWAAETGARHVGFWPHAGEAAGLVLVVIGILLAVAVGRSWWLPGGFEGERWRAPSAGKRKSRLVPGDSLLPGQSLYSPDGETRFTLEHDGNMVVYVKGRKDICDTGTHGDPKCLILEKDGWLILYDVADHRIWSRGPGGDHLSVQDNSHVVLYTAKNKPIWGTRVFVQGGMLFFHTGPASDVRTI